MHEDPARWRGTGQSSKSCAARVKRAVYTSEQFATKQFMERHENVTRGVMGKQDRNRADEYLREVSRLREHDRDERLDDPRDKKPREQEKRADLQLVEERTYS